MRKWASSFQISALSECADISMVGRVAQNIKINICSASRCFWLHNILMLNPLNEILFQSNIELVGNQFQILGIKIKQKFNFNT